ncbi:hypothetical protein FQN54_002050 [Arachnomyces sp. PD_36]|nr:hypothetical protein FQN54_002050 [Arachnomyces sp. PD_36]
MLKQQPPSPPPSTNEELKYDITRWAQPNGHIPEYQQSYNREHPEFQRNYQPEYQQEYQTEDQQNGLYTHRGLGGLPSMQERNMGLSVPGISLQEDYGHSPPYQSISGSEYPPIMPLPQPTFVRTSQLSPPATASEGGIRTRSGRSIPPPGSSLIGKTQDTDRVIKRTRSPRPKRPSRQPKTDKGQGPTISAPLSELTKDLNHIPIKDMEAWVNRSADVRQKEVERKNGKIARPMNSFMLYRSAYAERTKEWCSQNNHQVVSRASGQSWPLESKEVRDRFERFAAIERDNHQKAHPGYKFAPNKTQNHQPKKKRPQEGEDEPSDLDDPDFDLNSSPRNFHKRARGSETEDGYDSRNSTPFDQRSVDLYSHGSHLHPTLSRASSWQASTPGRPLPEMMSTPEHAHYFQPPVHPGMMGHSIEDVRFQKLDVPGLHYDNSGLLTGLPGNAHHDLLQPTSHASTPGLIDELQVDPELLAYDSGQAGVAMEGGEPYPNHLGDWQMPPGHNGHYNRSPLMMGEEHLPAQQPFHPGMQTLTDGRDPWQSHHDELHQLDAGAEFDEWFSTTGY